MPDLIRHPEVLEKYWIPAFAGMTTFEKTVVYGQILTKLCAQLGTRHRARRTNPCPCPYPVLSYRETAGEQIGRTLYFGGKTVVFSVKMITLKKVGLVIRYKLKRMNERNLSRKM